MAQIEDVRIHPENFLLSDMEEEGSNQKMTKCDMGGGRVKKPDFRSGILFALPLESLVHGMPKNPIIGLRIKYYLRE